MDPLEELINEVTDELNDETVKEKLLKESKTMTETVDSEKNRKEIFPTKLKSKFVATKPVLWEQNVQNLKNTNMKKK